MKRFLNRDNSQIAVVFLVLIQITATVCFFERDGQKITILEAEEDFLSENIFDDIANITEIQITGNTFSTFPENIFKSQPDLLLLDLNSNSLSTLPENIFKAQGYLTTLVLSWNNLNTLPENIFENQTKLRRLDLHGNKISTLSENIFKSQSELQELDLRDNNLSILSENIFDRLSKLLELDVRWNNLTTLPEKIFKSQANLKKLELSWINLKALPDNIFENQFNLETLELNGNELTALPEYIFKNVANLLRLDVAYNNNLTSLGQHIFENQTKLEQLDISFNNISTISEDIFKNLHNLSSLNLASNSLKILPANIFENLFILDTLDLGLNQLTTLPDDIFESQTNLKTLFLHGNGLIMLSENIFMNQSDLQSLDLRDNNLTMLPENIFKNLHNLLSLDLSSNRLTTLSEKIFESQADLQTLNLNSNNLTALPENIFNILTNLTTLSLVGNSLTALPDNIFKSQSKFEYIRLHGNQLSTLSKTTLRDIFKNEHLWHVSLSENPWQCDCDFLESIRPYMDGVLSSNEMECVDGVQLADKCNVPLTRMVMNKSIQSTKYNQKYAEINVCSVLPTNETKTCPSDCNCLFPSDETSVIVDCSNSSLKNVPTDLTTELKKMSAFNEIELNFDNNNITILPNLTTISGFGFIMNISAANNSIETISVDNLPENSMEIDLSGNKLEFLTSSVIEHLSNMKTLKSLILAGNPMICDQAFNDFVRLNKEKVDHENIVCYDRDSLFQKQKHQLNYWIKTNSRDGDEVKSMLTDSSESVFEINHDDVLGQICPTECSCFIAQQNTTISYECPVVSFIEILNHFELGKVQWPLLQHRRMIFNF